MERREPTFVPEWYKGSTGSSSGNSNHRSRSSWRSDERGARHLSSDRFSVSSSDHDSLRSSAFPDGRSSSYRRSLSSNGSSNHSRKNTSNLRPYSSFGRSHRDNDRKKDHDPRERSRSVFVENEFTKYTDSNIGSRNERDSLRRTSSSVGRLAEPLSKWRNSDLSNGVITGTSTNYINKHSFEREFPSLGVEDRQPDISRVSSPGLTALDNLSRISSMATGGDGWTSALAEAPARAGGNVSSSSSAALGSTSRLNMAEALVQAPPHTQIVSQESVDTQKIEEFTRLQYSKLIPIRPSMPKNLVLNSFEKSKVKVVRSGEYNAPSKAGLQSSSQHVGQPVRAVSRSDVAKTSQVGNNQVNREKNGVTSIARDGFNLLNISSGEKRSNSQTQNRNDFFKFIRQKAPAKCQPELYSISEEKEKEKETSTSYPGLDSTVSDVNAAEDVNVACEAPETSSPDEDVVLVSSLDPVAATSLPENGYQSVSSISLVIKRVNDNGDATLSSDPVAVSGDVGSFPDPAISGFVPEDFDRVSWDSVPPSEEEAAFLRSLGWNETTGIDALTPEEIAGYIQKYPKQKSSSMLNQ